MKLVLASGSPRRVELMKLVSGGLASEGLLDTDRFEIHPSDFDESKVGGLPPCDLVCRLAYEKAAAVLSETAAADDVIVGCDTVVSLDGIVFGKPSDTVEAVKMIGALSGRTHLVLTGVAVLYRGGIHTFSESTEVTFHTLSTDEIERYCSTPEPYDKAGGYGIQERGGLFVKCISGDYNNVVGLPMTRLYRVLRELLRENGQKSGE